MDKSSILKGSIITGVINGSINGLINWYQLENPSLINLTNDSISSQEHSVFGNAVVMGTSLGIILTSITYLTIKNTTKPNYFPKVFLLALKQSVFIFGAIVIFSILFHKIFGTIPVTNTTAAVVTGIIAGFAAVYVDFSTKKTLFRY